MITTGILINILNPKLTIFFFAFLPQFVRADQPDALPRMLELSAVFMLVTLVVFAIYGAFAASGVFAGIALSLGVFSLVTSAMSQETLLGWGWRVPYLLSVVVVGVGLYLRLAMPETPTVLIVLPP